MERRAQWRSQTVAAFPCGGTFEVSVSPGEADRLA